MHSKEAISKVKKQPLEWEKIIANETTDKGLISKILRVARTTQYQKNKEPNQKVGKRPKQTFLKEDIQKVKKHRKDAQHCCLLGKCKSKLQ